jgi:phage terminase large subunit GpA-like protein
MDISPAQIIYVTATESLAEKWATKRLDPLIDSCGIRHKIRAQTTNRKTRRTGDKTFRKEYFGGWLEVTSAQSPADLRQDSARILIRDEIDGAPKDLKSGEGGWLEVSYARTSAFGSRKKLLDYSTPTTFSETAIWPEYELADQRRYFVPCPHCGVYQKLEWSADDTALGMKWTISDGRITRVWYVCEHCHGEIENHHKGAMLQAGEWRATSRSHSDQVRSYHLSSLYSPVGMLSWEELVEIYLKASEKPDGMRAFVNLYLGLPYEEEGISPKAELVSENRGLYQAGTIPDGVLYLTAAVDVQQGVKNDPEKPPRLEMEVCGHGAGYRTWSIEYRVFPGAIDDPMTGAWEDLVAYWRSNRMIYQSGDGRKFPIKMVLIDSGDGTNTETVYRFCSPWQGVFPCKGFQRIKRKKGEALDEDMPTSFRRFRVANVGTDKPLYEVNTNHYKNLIYNNLRIRRNPVPPQKPGFCDFPVDYGAWYFNMLTAEKRRRDGSFHLPGGRANEALDARVYNLCAGDAFLYNAVLAMRADAKSRGAKPDYINAINSRAALEMLDKMNEKTRKGSAAAQGGR